MANSSGTVSFETTIQSPEVDFSKTLDISTIKDKTILITGGASGIGAAFFIEWAGLGANVVIGDISEDRGRKLVEKVKSSTGNTNLHFIKLDVTDWSSQVTFFREACKMSPHGGIDCVVANAGIVNEESMVVEEPPDYQNMSNPPPPRLKTLDVNLTGVLYTVTLANSYLPRNPGSSKCSVRDSNAGRDRHLLLVSSLAGLQPIPSQTLYAASKHAVIGIFRTLRVTAPIRHGIRVNVLCPYFADTPILGLAGGLIMAGGGLAEVQSIVEAGTRLVADSSIIGRGLAIGPKVNEEEAKAAGLKVEKQERMQAVWDVYAHDFEQSDIFSRRVVALTNIKGDQRGLTGLLSDLGWAFTSPLRRFFS